MVKSYFLLYKRAKKLLEEDRVKLTNLKQEEEKETYYFQANGHEVTLEVSKIPNTRLWLRHWFCTCKSYSLFQTKTSCKHIIASEHYLVNGGYNEVPA